jgi:hypothetical protein
MSSFNKIGITRPTAGQTHPFKIDIGKKGSKSDGTPTYTLAVNYHSRLYGPLKLANDKLQYEKIAIKEFGEDGIDFAKEVPNSFPGKNFYCVLEMDISNLKVTPPAKIVWVSSDQSEAELAPVVFEGSDNLKQTKARVIIGVFVADDEAIAGLPGNDSAVNTAYIMQFVNTNLIMCNMVFDGIPIVYPVPFAGGRLNF